MNEKQAELFSAMTAVVEESVPVGPLRDYILIETKAVCEQSENPHDDIASILFCSASSVLQVGRRILALRCKES